MGVEREKAAAAAIKDAPHLIFSKVPDWIISCPFNDLIFDGLEGILNNYSDPVKTSAHVMLTDAVVFD